MGYYKFYFKDENNDSSGWNDIQADNIEQAYEFAVRQYNHKGYDFFYDVIVDGRIESRVGRNTGMFVDKESIEELTYEQRNEMHRIADMMAR
jgi:hypothetical protein